MRNYFLIFSFIFACFGAQAQFELPKLAYATDAFSDIIDQETMEIHYGKHHQGYTKNLNEAIKEEKAVNLEIEQILNKISRFSTKMRNNAGGYYNHQLFWDILTPHQTKPSQSLITAIKNEFGSLDEMIEEMNTKTASQFGSGWGWLIVTKSGSLKIVTTANQDNPLMDVVPTEDQGTPIIGIDVWEHAYYLKYQNKRGAYLENIWNIINWDSVNERYKVALQTKG